MRFAILGSGRGSNAEALLQSWKAGELGRAQPVLILADRDDAGILRFGERFGVEANYLDPGAFRTKLEGEGEASYISTLEAARVDLIVLAGFMRVIKPAFLGAFPDQVINLHPSLLPSFPGLNAIRQAWDYGVKVTGCTVHRVIPEIDAGPILGQETVLIEDTDTLETLEAKVHSAEHRLLPQVVKALSTAS